MFDRTNRTREGKKIKLEATKVLRAEPIDFKKCISLRHKLSVDLGWRQGLVIRWLKSQYITTAHLEVGWPWLGPALAQVHCQFGYTQRSKTGNGKTNQAAQFDLALPKVLVGKMLCVSVGTRWAL